MTPKPANTAVGKTSHHRGVSYNNGKWLARIHVDGKQRHLGLFADEAAAAAAYVAACREIGRDLAPPQQALAALPRGENA